MKDEETGVEAIARDGEVSDELALARERAKLAEEPANGGNGRGKPIDEQDVGEEDDGQLFVWEQGRKVTLSTLIARNVPVEHAFVFGGKRLKATGGLVGFDEDVLIVCRGRVKATSMVPTRDDDERVTKVTIETHIAAKAVVPADSDQAISMLSGIFERRGIRAA